jgi:hypothetical protein
MRISVTGFTDGKKIHAIKGIRAVSGLGLKEAKDVMDDAAAGIATVVEVSPGVGLRALDEHGVTYRKLSVPLDEFIAALSDYPAGLRVGDLVRVLSVVADSA